MYHSLGGNREYRPLVGAQKSTSPGTLRRTASCMCHPLGIAESSSPDDESIDSISYHVLTTAGVGRGKTHISYSPSCQRPGRCVTFYAGWGVSSWVVDCVICSIRGHFLRVHVTPPSASAPF